MKILLCNKFYYRRGGDCIYSMHLEQLLRQHGHEVAVFSQQFPLNEKSEWSKYWPTEFKMKPSLTMLDSLLRPFGKGSVVKRFTALLDDFRPDVVHLNNIHTQLSPILAELAHQRGIRVVWTIHDTKLVCPCYTCQRDGKWCEECFTHKHAVLRHRCMTGGWLGSFIGYHEAMTWSAERLMAAVDTFICPSQFMAETMVRGGFRRDKMRVLSNFIDEHKVDNPSFVKQDYYLFLGRVNEVKGIRTLCQAASALPYTVKVVGDGELLDQMRQQYASSQQIEFLGKRDWTTIRPLIEGARFLVIPSEWSENNPLSVIESLSLGTPVLGANIGGIPELITPSNGQCFESGNAEELRQGITEMWHRTFGYATIAQESLSRYGAENYYNTLIQSLYK